MEDRSFWKDKKVLVTGGAGFIGSYVLENLINKRNVAPTRITVPRSRDGDLRIFENCKKAVEGCHIIIHLAAVTGGISFSRTNPASQYYDSTLIDLNLVEAARQEGVEKMVTIGNLFAYATDVPMPIIEGSLFDGLPTEAHRGVGWLKRNLAILADLYYRQYKFPMVVVYSANAYGPRDSTDPVHSHVIPATIMKCFRDPELVVWGDGSPTRDFLYVEDIAEGLITAAEKLKPPNYVNIGSGKEITIKEMVNMIAIITGYKGKITFDHTKSGGDARRCTSNQLSNELMGFHPEVSIAEGLTKTVTWYRQELHHG